MVARQPLSMPSLIRWVDTISNGIFQPCLSRTLAYLLSVVRLLSIKSQIGFQLRVPSGMMALAAYYALTIGTKPMQIFRRCWQTFVRLVTYMVFPLLMVGLSSLLVIGSLIVLAQTVCLAICVTVKRLLNWTHT